MLRELAQEPRELVVTHRFPEYVLSSAASQESSTGDSVISHCLFSTVCLEVAAFHSAQFGSRDGNKEVSNMLG